MIITTIEHVKQLPKGELRCYYLRTGFTAEDAAKNYENIYRIPPVNGWRWGNYLYLEVPE